MYSPPVEIFADGVSILPRQTEFQEVYVAQAVDMGRSAIYFHFPERITPACTSFDALYFYIAGFYVIEEKILFPGFPRLDMIYVLPMLSIVGYLYFIFFAIGCFPVQTDTINIDRLLQVDIEPFVVTGPARPAGAFVAVCDIFRSSVLCRRNDYRFVLGDIGYMLIKRNEWLCWNKRIFFDDSARFRPRCRHY